MIHNEVIELAAVAGYDAVAYELNEAKKRAEDQLTTEAVMRLGRATEATLYAVAREYEVNLQLHIPELAALQDSLRGTEAKILKNGDVSEVRKLADLSKQLAEAIAALMENEDSREGASGDRVRGNDSILSELILVVDDPASKRRLGQNRELLRSIMTQRNSGAHASPTGELRETDPSVFAGLAKDFESFIRTLLEVAIGEQSHRMWADT